MMNSFKLSRIEHFRQFKQNIRGSDRYLIVGIDISKNMHHGFFGTANGRRILKTLRFENTAQGFDALVSKANYYMDRDGFDKSVFAVEPTSVYHKPLCEFLINKGQLVVYVTNEAIKKNRSLLDGRWDKNDAKDAANIADLVAQGKCHYYDLPDTQLRDVRNLLLLRRRLKKQHHGARVRIRNNIIAQYFPEMDSLWSKSDTEILIVVRWCLSPQQIAQMPFNEFFKLVTTRDKDSRQYQRVKHIWDLAADSIGCKVTKAVQIEARTMVEMLIYIQQQIKLVDELIDALCSGFDAYRNLLSIPGFGPYVSAVVMSAIGNPHRFANVRQVIKLAGFDLSANRSGKKSTSAAAVISKKGKTQLRYALYQAAIIASSLTSSFRPYYHRLLDGRQKEKGIRTKMRVKLAVKLLVIAWTLMKNNEPFDQAHLKT